MADSIQAPDSINNADILYFAYLLTFNHAPAPDGSLPPHADGDPEKAAAFGNIRGLIEKLDYIQSLGTSAIWISPPQDSNLEHGHGYGYDAIDYNAINASLGTEDDFRELTAEAHRRGMSVIVDQVYNHTSKEHPWFRASAKGEEPYSHYYVWQEPIVVAETDERVVPVSRRYAVEGGEIDIPRYELRIPRLDEQGKETGEVITLNPLPDYSKPVTALEGNVVVTDETGSWLFEPRRDANGNIMFPPNNFIRVGGSESAWSYDETRGACYEHFFHDTMPDLNIGYTHPATGERPVDDKIIEQAKWWIDEMGADGFRCDAARMVSTHWMLRSTQEDAMTRLKAEGLNELAERVGQMNSQDYALFQAGFTSNPVNEQHQAQESEQGNLFAGWHRYEHLNDIAQPAGIEFWQRFSEEMNRIKPVTLLMENGDGLAHGARMREAGAGHYFYTSAFDRVSQVDCGEPGNWTGIRQAVEENMAHFSDGRGMSWTFDNHDTSRMPTRMRFYHPGEDRYLPLTEFSTADRMAATGLLFNFLSRLPGNICIYNGTELGLDTPTGHEVNNRGEGDDRGQDVYNLFRDRTGDKNSRTHDFGRAAMPWGDETDTGHLRFMKTPASWQAWSVELQEDLPQSPLHRFREAFGRRREGEEAPLLSSLGPVTFYDAIAEDGKTDCNILVYQRDSIEEHVASRLYIDNFQPVAVTIDLAGILSQMPKEHPLTASLCKHITERGPELEVEAWGSASISQQRTKGLHSAVTRYRDGMEQQAKQG